MQPLKVKGLSPKTVRNAFQLLSAAMNMCRKWGILENNACENVILPDVEQKEVQYLDNDETIRFIQCLNHVPREEYNYKVAALYSLFASLRKGEIFGLNEQEVELEKGYLKISHARYAKAGGGTYRKDVGIGNISDQLGHASRGVTERYLHKFKAPERQIADSLESFLKASQK